MRVEILAGKRAEVGREVAVSRDLRNLSDGERCFEAHSCRATLLIKDSLVPGASNFQSFAPRRRRN